ncbi:sulfur carrier protein ThiS [Croceivirga sp. JEA036]|uniref:sulfur carrier protein ThiS n=1 Tax=Croceivirga sp. JEA036 TaxID=2721162 RepID=UPI001438F56D|nr:sulfur carrier protein ThiS [Croceivirga sp. JEA036]NJB35420.1 sulfur carrier protein ThiS [Croceivirga sp. JEA036]
MVVTLNENNITTTAGISLSQFVATQLPSTAGIALAVNDAVVFKQDWESTVLQEGDAILVVRATQGG